MPSNETRAQLAKIVLRRNRPVLVCDVDEVVVQFIHGFETYLSEQDLWLDPQSFALNGNVKTRSGNQPVGTEHLGRLLEGFFADRTKTLAAIDGAVEGLLELAEILDIVMLTNIPHHHLSARIENLRSHGLEFPVVSNSGLKGPAIARLLENHSENAFFIDDLPHYLQSAREYCPSLDLVHFMGDDRFREHLPPMDFPHLAAHTWADIVSHIQQRVDRS